MEKNKKSQPKKHHFVPECYLNKFLSNDRLFVLDIRKVKKGLKEVPHQTHPSSICYLEDYYRIKGDLPEDIFKFGVEDPLHIESKLLWNLETKYDNLLQKLIRDKRLSHEDAETFSDFIIQLKLRNPFWLENTLEKKKDDWIDDSISKIAKNLNESSRYNHIPEEIRTSVIENIRNQNKNSLTFSKKLQLYSIIMRYEQNVDTNTRIRKALLKSTWSLIEAPQDGPFFVTSDNPGGAIGIDNLYYNTRFENGFQFFLSLSPLYCLGITDSLIEIRSETKTKKIDLLKANQQFVILINNIEIQHVNKFIIARDKWYLDQIAEINRPQK